MTKEKYEKLVLEAREKYNKAIADLNIRFSKEKNPYGVGDIIADYHKKIKIEKISFGHMLAGTPVCLYVGPLLKKDNKPYSHGKNGSIWQYNVKG